MLSDSVTFGNTECIVSKNGKELIRGTKNTENGLWYIPISNNGKALAIQDRGEQLNSAYHISTMPETIKFIHQCLFSPTVDTLCKAIDNNQLIELPHLTLKIVRKYLPDSTATAKGHMNRTKCGLRSTTKSQAFKADEIEKYFRPEPNEDAEVEIFIGATIGEQNDGVIYQSDLCK